MAGPDIPKIEEEISRESERTIREVEKREGQKKALEFAQAYGDMHAALDKIVRALDRSNFKNDSDYEKANAAFGEKLADALRGFQTLNNVGAREMAVEETRTALKSLGVLAEKGPASYPKPSFGMGLFQPSQVEQWLNDVGADPVRVAAEMADAAGSAQTEAQTAGAANPTERHGGELAAAEVRKLNQRTHGAFGINTGDE